jgi:alkanesulfonate monooxygenase SsuD/methylene tetrahydromethanopterin reductase-like flavin-dependent oxidoreductase (luciferase family)
MPIRLALRYDMRAPSFGASASALYAAALDQTAIADVAGFDVVYLAEHHGAEDGYCPSPMTLAAAMAGRTSRIRLHLSALVAVLHHPLQLAEDLAVLDLVSNGRVEMTLGIGYRLTEYQMFGVKKARRVQILDEIIDTLEMAWTGMPFSFRGQELTILPTPRQQPGPPIFIGGSTEASARRAARTSHGYLPATPQLFDVFAAERTRLGGAVPPRPRAKGPLFLFVSDDPSRDWDIVGPHLMYNTNMTAAWARERGVGATPYPSIESVEQLRTMSQFRVVTPSECVKLIESVGSDAEFTFHPLMGGLPPQHGTASLTLFVEQVLPVLADKGLWVRPSAGSAAVR